jgi:hypothetical protein
MANTPLIIATREAIKVTIGCTFAILSIAPDTLIAVAKSALLFVIFNLGGLVLCVERQSTL